MKWFERAVLCAGAVFFPLGLGPMAQETALTTFDFSAAQVDQSGTYEADASLELTATGEAQPRLSASDWVARANLVRVGILVDDVAFESPRGIVELSPALLPSSFVQRALADGSDLVAFDSLHNPLPRPYATAGTSLSAGTGQILVKQELLPAGSSSFFLYGGDADNATVVDEFDFLTDPTPTVRYYATGSYTGSQLSVGTLIENNEIVHAGGSVLLPAPGSTVGLDETTTGPILTAEGPIGGSWFNAEGDAIVPESLAGTSFVIPAPRFDEDIFVAAPFANTTLVFTSPILADVVVAEGAVQKIATVVANDSVIVFDASAPIVVVRGSIDGDITPMPPAANELLGMISGTALVAAGALGATVTVTQSDGTSQVVAVAANSLSALFPVGQIQGSGATLRLSSSSPIGALTYGDGDGAEAVAFLPPGLLGTSFLLTEDAQFVVIAADQGSTHCNLSLVGGSLLASATTPPTPVPGRLFFGSTTNGSNLAAPSFLVCDKPVHAIYEAAASDTEKLLIGASNHRPHVGSITLTSSETETRFSAGTAGVQTPTFSTVGPMTGIVGMTATSLVEAGAALRFQVSLDGGTTWLIPEGGSLQTDISGEGAAVGDFAGATFQPSHDLTLRALLETDGVADVSLDEAIVEVTLGPSADLTVGISDAVDPLLIGGDSSYTITATNLGPSEATGVTMSLTLSDATTFVAVTPGLPACEESSRVVNCDLGSMPFGDTRVVNVEFVETSGTPGVIEASAVVQASEVDPATGNNLATVETEVIATATVFLDGFESGNTSAWSATVP